MKMPNHHAQLLALTLGVFAVSALRFTFAPIQEIVRSALSLSDNQIAILQGPAVAIPLAIAALFMGSLLADSRRRSRVLVMALVAGLLAQAMIALSEGFASLLAGRILIGIAFAAFLVGSYSAIGDLYSADQRGRATGVVLVGEIGAGPVVFGSAALLLSIISQPLLGGDPWRVVVLAISAPLVFILPLLWLVRDAPNNHDVISNTSSAGWVELWLHRGIVLPLILSRVLIWIADTTVFVWGVSIIARRYSLPPELTSSLMATILLVSGIAGPVLGGFIADLCQRTGGPRRTIAGMAVLTIVSVPAALFGIAPNATLFTIGATTLVATGFMIATLAIAVTNVAIPANLRSRFVAAQYSAGALVGLGLAPLLVSWISGQLGGMAWLGEATAIICVVSSLLAAASFAMGYWTFPTGPIPAASQRGWAHETAS